MSEAPKQVWQCPVTKKVFDTEDQAKNSARAFKAAQTRKAKAEEAKKERLVMIDKHKDILKEKASDFYDFAKIIKENSVDFLKVDVNAICINNVTYHEFTGGGWDTVTFSLSMAVKDLLRKRKCCRSLADTFFAPDQKGKAGFSGVVVRRGGWSPLDSDQFSVVTATCTITLSDFPLWGEKLRLYRQLLKAHEDGLTLRNTIRRESKVFVEELDEWKAQYAVCQDLEKKLRDARSVLNTIQIEAQDMYQKFCDKAIDYPPPPPEDLTNRLLEDSGNKYDRSLKFS